MGTNPTPEKREFVVVRTDTNQKVAGPFTESEARDKVKDQALKEAAGNAGLSVKQILHG